jgi:GAF domain-containing protein
MGAGLGGLVAQTRQPYATPDYPRDPRFLHTVDAIVNAEGLVAVLGVPLLLREKVIGVLFAAHRHERPFADAEVALLISLAAHAAIAIETASLFADVRAHIDQVERACTALTALVAQGSAGRRRPGRWRAGCASDRGRSGAAGPRYRTPG